VSRCAGRISTCGRVRREADPDPARFLSCGLVERCLANKYGDQYYLSRLFDEEYKDGAELRDSHYEKLAKTETMKPETRRVPGRHGSGGPR
jgi:hypothetical protein